MYFVIWSNYDGLFIERTESVTVAEDKIAEIEQRGDRHDYGTQVEIVVEGRELKWEPVQYVDKVKIPR